jgi:hypothetical protein
MGILDRIRKRKEVDPHERRRHLLAHGRITDGVIIDSQIGPDGREIAYFLYTLNGVDFESSEILTDDQRNQPVKYAPGAKINIRYDPKNQGNSVIE